MAPGHITVVVQDDGYFRKPFGIKPSMSVKKLIDRYCNNLCRGCTKPETLESWYETTKLDNQNAKVLEMQDGDNVDVRTGVQCTRGACPVPAAQTIPNIHYLAIAPVTPDQQKAIQEPIDAPPAPDRITFKMKDINGIELTWCIKRNTPMIQAMQAFATHVWLRIQDCRFLVPDSDERILNDSTPASIGLEENDSIEVHYAARGGGAGSN